MNKEAVRRSAQDIANRRAAAQGRGDGGSGGRGGGGPVFKTGAHARGAYRRAVASQKVSAHAARAGGKGRAGSFGGRG